MSDFMAQISVWIYYTLSYIQTHSSKLSNNWYTYKIHISKIIIDLFNYVTIIKAFNHIKSITAGYSKK